jgi:hypothetical protein
MKLNIKRILIYSIILWSVIYVFLSSKASYLIYGQLFFHNSYINEVFTPYYTSEDTMMLLKEFDSMAGGGIVKLQGSRPINITEMPMVIQLMYPDSLGITFLEFKKCNIFIRPYLDHITFRETLFHEYLHCFAYDHSPNPKDLMYYAEVPVDKEENIKYHAKELKERYYAPKFYRIQ